MGALVDLFVAVWAGSAMLIVAVIVVGALLTLLTGE